MKDRISVLPDEVIHHIFSFMNMPDVIHTSILSNRWKHLWLSTPTLKFNYDRLDCHCLDRTCSNMCIERRTKHVNFMNRVLITRQTNLVKFQMSDNHPWADTNHVLTCLIGVLGLHAQEIILRSDIEDIFHLPHHLFNPNIRVLELDFLGMLIFLPNSISRAIRLTSLVLNNVWFPSGNADGEFILSFPVLENLKIHSCYLGSLSVLTVSTPLLKRLELWSLYTSGKFSCTVKISAPSLSLFHVSISAMTYCRSVDFCVEDLVSLVSASIGLYSENENAYTAIHIGRPLVDILTGFHNVEVLEVSNRLIQVITSTPKLLKRLPKLLKNLRSLMVMDVYETCVPEKVCKVQEAVIFMEQLPHVENLVWERTYMHYWLYKDDVWEATTQYQGIFSRLKSFEFQNFLGFEAEQNFLEFLLERATVLKELIIKTPSLALVDGTKVARYKETLSLYGDKLSSLPRSSSSVTISYKIKS